MDNKKSMMFIKIGIAILLAILVIYFLSKTVFNTKKSNESFADYKHPVLDDDDFLRQRGTEARVEAKVDFAGSMQGDGHVKPIPFGPKRMPMGIATDLLPKDKFWGKEVESFDAIAPRVLEGQNFLEADRFVSVDTVSTSNKNANYQLRMDPPITKQDVGVWSMSSYDKKDDLRKPLDN
jgi:hypothetical protein